MRIITGKYKNRVIKANWQADYRPSTSKLREALFSIITSQHFDDILEGSSVLDLYCGSGILSFESLSRGASSATFVDINPRYLDKIREFAAQIGASDAIDTICANVLDIRKFNKKYDLVFIDPPYGKDLTGKTMDMIVSGDILTSGALICIETLKTEMVPEYNLMELVTQRVIGNSRLTILRYTNPPGI